MAIDPLQLAAASAVLGACGRANPVTQLREQLSDVTVSCCDPEDLRGERPYWQVGEHFVYLIDTTSHCWRIVNAPEQASGIVVALVAPAQGPAPFDPAREAAP